MKNLHFALVGIPLSRPDIVDFLLSQPPKPTGRPIYIVGQRPSTTTEAAWVRHLKETAVPTINDLLQIDDPHGHLVPTVTGRLVPAEFLAEPGFLTRALGGWVANYFAVVGLTSPLTNNDPLLSQAEILKDYGQQIHFFGAEPKQVAKRLPEEISLTETAVATAFCQLHALRQNLLGPHPALYQTMAYIERLYGEIALERNFATAQQPALPKSILIDELMGQLVVLEMERRTAVANQDQRVNDEITAWQEVQRQATGLQLLLKGEYIVGRHRRSTILIAPEMGVVVKQPAPEPFHEIELKAKTVQGQAENWPIATGDGALVTARGRLRLILEENLIPRLSHVFNYKVHFSTLLGLTTEPFINGKTVQAAVWDDNSCLTPKLYEEILLHQLVCEQLGIENGDWHAANFIIHQPDEALVHVDWGAARPLQPQEHTAAGEQARLDQVRNIAFSFKHAPLVSRTEQLHNELTGDASRMKILQSRAREFSEK